MWVKLHKRLDASRRFTKKIHLVYDGPFRVARIIRKNAYLIEDREGQTIGVYNSRQMKPHRSTEIEEFSTEDEEIE